MLRLTSCHFLARNFAQTMTRVLFLAEWNIVLCLKLAQTVTHLYKQCCAWPHAIFWREILHKQWTRVLFFSRVKRCTLSQTCANNDTYSKCLIAHHWHNMNKYCKIKLCISKLSLRPREFMPFPFYKKKQYSIKNTLLRSATCAPLVMLKRNFHHFHTICAVTEIHLQKRKN